DARNLAGTSGYALFKWAVTPFSGGSDHYLFADPAVGIPCPMVIQWPAKFYHTNADTIDKVDPAMLRRAAIMASAYAYAVAATASTPASAPTSEPSGTSARPASSTAAPSPARSACTGAPATSAPKDRPRSAPSWAAPARAT